MKTNAVLVALLLLTTATRAANQTGSIIQVASWNIRDLSILSRSQAELRQIATVIHTNDCVAICELNDNQVLGRLCTELNAFGGNWKSVQTTTKSGNTPASREYYGYVYRRDKVWPRTPVRILAPKTYTVPGDSATYHFDRVPAYCKFATLDGRLDFTIIMVHITWGDHESHRKAEVRVLADYFTTVQNADSNDNDVLLCGDFNQNVNAPDSLSELLKVPHLADTTLPGIPTVIQGHSTYDHILFQTNHVTEYTGNHGVTMFDTELFHGNISAAKTACSDHRPVWIQLRVPPHDDD